MTRLILILGRLETIIIHQAYRAPEPDLRDVGPFLAEILRRIGRQAKLSYAAPSFAIKGTKGDMRFGTST
ncbi:hypothetical protein IVB33_39235 [Bradyrhizobium sp. 24]|uniref:hypothetical protein n=1 Tax=unclassified Bradyrhizobium TaxID=2631580 RepID=UPI001FFA39B2|nr:MULTISPECIES: hypothetical protein [unclassified Bradyrhizobium]MCK1299710.1 hypothetical protein [Bradyrhizobium sp. 37]MCK1382396.1 hypothetical protein [Bradyrhizobium sp. 24]MCK1771460.1 hypothetical protein [Bradyrhizobium sp. 134]